MLLILNSEFEMLEELLRMSALYLSVLKFDAKVRSL
jgi:hypothetical protein